MLLNSEVIVKPPKLLCEADNDHSTKKVIQNNI